MTLDYMHAKDALDALALAAAAPKAVFVAGGTSFAAAGGPPKGARLVDLSRAGLDFIARTPAGFALGAATPVAALARREGRAGAPPLHPAGVTDPGPLVPFPPAGTAGGKVDGRPGGSVTLQRGAEGAAPPALPSLLTDAARAIGSPQIRNMVTVGGNVLAGHAWSALPPALLSLDATLVFLGETGERRVRYAEWLEARPTELPRLLVAVEFPDPGERARGTFLTLRKSTIDFPLVTVAALAPASGGVRVSLFGCTRRPLRLFALERAVGGAIPGGEALEAAAREAFAALEIAGGYRIDPDHARAAGAALAARAIRAVMGGDGR